MRPEIHVAHWNLYVYLGKVVETTIIHMYSRWKFFRIALGLARSIRIISDYRNQLRGEVQLRDILETNGSLLRMDQISCFNSFLSKHALLRNQHCVHGQACRQICPEMDHNNGFGADGKWVVSDVRGYQPRNILYCIWCSVRHRFRWHEFSSV